MAYDKANSLQLIREDADTDADAGAGAGVGAKAIGRIARLAHRMARRMGPPESGQYEERIVRRACEDLLDNPAETGEARFLLRPHVVEEISRITDEELFRYLFYRYRYEVFPVTKQLDAYPPCLQIEPTSICNYRCVFCYHTVKEFTNPANGHMGHMSLDLFKRIIDEVDGRCEAITLASRGEPLICPDIEGMLAYLAGKALASKMNTNAWFLDERKAHAILAADIQTLVFSVDAASEPLYSQLRVNGRLDRVMTNIKRFNALRMRHYPESRLITRISGVRYHEDQNAEEMQRVWGEHVDQVSFVDWHNTHEHGAVHREAVHREATHREAVHEEKPCSELWRRTFIWFDGTVNPCEVDFLSTTAVGSLDSASLSDIWRNEAYERLRDKHMKGNRGSLSPCDCCSTV